MNPEMRQCEKCNRRFVRRFDEYLRCPYCGSEFVCKVRDDDPGPVVVSDVTIDPNAAITRIAETGGLPVTVGIDPATGVDRTVVTAFPARGPYTWKSSDPPPAGNREPMRPDPEVRRVMQERAAEQMKRAVDERRLRVVHVPERYLFEMLTLPTRVRDCVAVLDCDPPLPDGVEVLPGPGHDRLSRCFVFFVRHPSFDPVADGEQPPRWPLFVRYRLMWVVPDDGS